MPKNSGSSLSDRTASNCDPRIRSYGTSRKRGFERSRASRRSIIPVDPPDRLGELALQQRQFLSLQPTARLAGVTTRSPEHIGPGVAGRARRRRAADRAVRKRAAGRAIRKHVAGGALRKRAAGRACRTRVAGSTEPGPDCHDQVTNSERRHSLVSYTRPARRDLMVKPDRDPITASRIIPLRIRPRPARPREAPRAPWPRFPATPFRLPSRPRYRQQRPRTARCP
jgi:hypothetical protein